jgi:desulfoferrodoxin (superoxide reductase-like protein)
MMTKKKIEISEESTQPTLVRVEISSLEHPSTSEHHTLVEERRSRA